MGKISVIIPAHNEEKYISRCIGSIRESEKLLRQEVEIIVVCNRCTDQTQSISQNLGAKVVFNNERCIASVRNEGIFNATGDIIVTIDADNRMTEGTLKEIYDLLESGKYIGGGAPIRFERYSFPLRLNDWLCRISFALTGLYCGIFWAEKEKFETIGGFAKIKAMEDVKTAKLLKKYGKTCKKRYTHLKKNYLINSTRKFDKLGDWLYLKLIFKNFGTFIKAAFGKKDKLDKLLDELFYDYNNEQ